MLLLPGTNAQGTCPAAASQTGGSSFSLACTGLTAGTAYKVWCATDTTAVLSNAASITPVAQVYSAQPSAVATASVADGTGITITATIARTESQRCIALLANASNPTAAAVTPMHKEHCGKSNWWIIIFACMYWSYCTAYKVWCATDTSTFKWQQ